MCKTDLLQSADQPNNIVPNNSRTITEKISKFLRIHELAKQFNIKKYSIKIMSIGTKIQVNSMNDFDELNKELISTDNTFFTYETVKNKTSNLDYANS